MLSESRAIKTLRAFVWFLFFFCLWDGGLFSITCLIKIELVNDKQSRVESALLLLPRWYGLTIRTWPRIWIEFVLILDLEAQNIFSQGILVPAVLSKLKFGPETEDE